LLSLLCRRLQYVAVVSLLCVVVLGSSAKTVTLQWATWGPAPIDQELIATFEKMNPDIKIEYIGSTYGEHHPKMKVLTAGDWP
jgi:ABC-type glycerol-3-phosphate transport system substrate-binding protein